MLMSQIETLRQSQETTRRAHEEQIEGLRRTAEDMSAHIRNLETNYQNVLGEIVHFQRNMASQDNLVQNLIGYFIGMENSEPLSLPILTTSHSSSQRKTPMVSEKVRQTAILIISL
jgi:hypothetical protein